jgi:CRISPR-associated endonuclease/helicase Cas3
MEILAKSQSSSNPKGETLIYHTQYCLFFLKKVLDWKADLINQVCKHYKLDPSVVRQKLFLTVAFHDIGKANSDFQAKLRKGRYKKESHPLSSLPFIYHFTKDKPILENEDENKFYPESLAVVSHHAKLHKDLFQDYGNIQIRYADTAYFYDFFAFLNIEAQNFFTNWQPLVFDVSIIKNPKPLGILNDLRIDAEDLYGEKQKMRDIFLLFKSILHYSDWLASGDKKNYIYSTDMSLDDITETMRKQLADKNIKFEKWSDFQLETAKCPQNIFVQIPTGQGKTEASLLWAVQQNKSQKIIYLLPTQVTTTKMWQRLRDFFGDENTGLSHGAAQYVLSEELAELEEYQLRNHYLMNRTFFKPVSVATIDQLIFSFFNWGHWVMSGSAAYNAKIVIDEVHIYDGYTFGLLLQTIEYIKPFNTQFAIMSASLPKLLRDEIEKILPAQSFTYINEPAFDEKQRHQIFTNDNGIESLFGDISKDLNEGKKVLIVCNTIKTAKAVFALFDEFPKKQKMLYHSQFILSDKKDKEDFLTKTLANTEGAYLAICTQIVEVSLDIDFEILYTENAPIDALIQRLGRVNRKGAMKDENGDKLMAKVVICKENEVARKYIYSPDILDETFNNLKIYIENLNGNLKEKHLKELVEIVYIRENLPPQYFKDLDDGRKLIKDIWEKCVKNIYTLSGEEKQLNDISSRKINYVTIECLLLKHYIKDNLEEKIKAHQYNDLVPYTIKIPMHIIKQNKAKVRSIENRSWWLVDFDYNSTDGILYKQSEDINIF